MHQLRNSLNPEVTTFEVFEKVKDELLKDSGLWILDEELFSTWMDGTILLLFIFGVSRCRKIIPFLPDNSDPKPNPSARCPKCISSFCCIFLLQRLRFRPAVIPLNPSDDRLPDSEE